MFNSPSNRFINGRGTGAPAMIPVRRFDESKFSGLDNCLKHGWHAVQGRTFLVGDGMQDRLRIKRLAGENDLRSVGDHGQHSED